MNWVIPIDTIEICYTGILVLENVSTHVRRIEFSLILYLFLRKYFFTSETYYRVNHFKSIDILHNKIVERLNEKNIIILGKLKKNYLLD